MARPKNENDFFFTPQGAEYLQTEYVHNKNSIYVIAKAKNTYPAKVWRALEHHGYARRNLSEAQKQALESGRHPHPTAGKKRKKDESDGVLN